MSWSEVGDVLHRWAAVFLLGIVFFRFAFEVAIWPSLLVLLAGCLVAGTLRRRFLLWWVLGAALLMSGIWGLSVTLGASDWSDMIRPEPFGQILLSLYILLGAIALVVVFKKLHS
jgi:hypothetical protein